MTAVDNAHRFAQLHQKGTPVVLYNIWDAGSAKTLAEAGAPAVATGSWSVAAAQGFDDGELIPLDFLCAIVDRVVQSVEVPVSVDFEGGYAVQPADVAANVERLLRAGAVGINFEDGVVRGSGLHPVSLQAERIRAISSAAEAFGVPLFINARTDLFLTNPPQTHGEFIAEALTRQSAYAEAGASGFFVPGLVDRDLIAALCDQAELPVNVMMSDALASVAVAADLGVSRVSFGPSAYRQSLSDLTDRFAAL